MPKTITRSQRQKLSEISKRTDSSDAEQWVESFLVFNSEYEDERGYIDGELCLTFPCAKAYARWLVAEGVCDKSRAIGFLKFAKRVEKEHGEKGRQ